MSTRAERKFDQYPYADPDDHSLPVMKEAISELLQHHSEVKQMKHLLQLKLSPTVSFYPTTKRVLIDGDPGSVENYDVQAVVRLLRERDELASGDEDKDLRLD